MRSAPCLRQANAVIAYCHSNEARVRGDVDRDATAVVEIGVAPARFDGLGGILQHIGHRLAELMPVARNRRHFLGRRKLEVDFGARNFLQEQRLTDEIDRRPPA